jgi:thymidine kinase
VVGSLQQGARIDYLICDEAQFYTPAQVDQLARMVDDLGIDVLAFGLLTDFRTRLFAGSARLVEVADRVQTLQVEALCWCGSRATHNARTVGGVMCWRASRSGRRPPRGRPGGQDPAVAELEDVRYEVLCRRHHRRRMTAAAARAADLSPAVLPFDADQDAGP